LILIPFGGSFLQTFLFNVKKFDLLTITGTPAVLLAVSFLASLGPARAATRSDPALTLREE
jgi:ABC-type lipoprotein release transport system permease subunit